MVCAEIGGLAPPPARRSGHRAHRLRVQQLDLLRHGVEAQLQWALPADLLPGAIAIVDTTRDIIQLLDGHNVNWATVLKLGRVKGCKANWNRRGCQQTLAAISSGDIRSLLNIVETEIVCKDC
jgi:hypothetical protein